MFRRAAFLLVLLAGHVASAQAPPPPPPGSADPKPQPGISPLGAVVSDASRPREHPLVVFRGNVLFNEFVYRALLEPQAPKQATLEAARELGTRIADFLRRAGYELASVRAQVSGDQIILDIDEGQLDKILILGEGVVTTLRLKLELNLPFEVFNRPQLEKQLTILARRFHLRDYAYELWPVGDKPVSGPQLDKVEELRAVPFFKPGRLYELRILLDPDPWGKGIAPELAINGSEGLGLGARVRGAGLLRPEDRWEVRLRLGTALRGYLTAPGSRLWLSRALAEARWIAPPVIGDSFRPVFGVRADLWGLQRSDLSLERFNLGTLEAGAGLSEQVLPELWVALGVGVQRRILFGLESITTALDAEVDATPRAQTRPFVRAVSQLTFNPHELRRDRRDIVELDAALYAPSAAGRSGLLRVEGLARKVFDLGWNEVWTQGRVTSVSGDVLFPDEVSLGDHLRAVFGGQHYAPRIVSLQVDFRYSLLRDVIKAGPYADLAAFGDRQTAFTTQLAGVAGVAVHALVYDEFSVDAYAGHAWSTTGDQSSGVALQIRQAY